MLGPDSFAYAPCMEPSLAATMRLLFTDAVAPTSTTAYEHEHLVTVAKEWLCAHGTVLTAWRANLHVPRASLRKCGHFDIIL